MDITVVSLHASALTAKKKNPLVILDLETWVKNKKIKLETNLGVKNVGEGDVQNFFTTRKFRA